MTKIWTSIKDQDIHQSTEIAALCIGLLAVSPYKNDASWSVIRVATPLSKVANEQLNANQATLRARSVLLSKSV